MREYSKSARNNLETILAYLLLFFLPTQLGKHFWPAFSFVLGQRVDYLSPTFYFTDALILLLFLVWITDWQRLKKYLNKTISQFFIFVYVFLLATIILSPIPILGWYYLIKIIEFAFFGWITAQTFKKHTVPYVRSLAIGMVFESGLAIAQYMHGGSLNGIFYFFGERMYSSSTPGVANASINGALILRPYGTFSHPNVLAAYLLLGMTMIVGFRGKGKGFSNRILIIVVILGTTALLLSLSRVAIVLWLLSGFFFIRKWVWSSITKKRLTLIICFSTALAIVGLELFLPTLLSRFFTTSFSDESVVLRERLAADAIAMICHSPFVGIGLHNFLVVLPFFDHASATVFTLQPVHNIFLLVGAETGFIGLILFVSMFIALYRKLYAQYHEYSHKHIWNFIQREMKRHTRLSHHTALRVRHILTFIVTDRQSQQIKQHKQTILVKEILLTEVVILGMFDHYFLTIQQGQMLLALIMGLLVVNKK